MDIPPARPHADRPAPRLWLRAPLAAAVVLLLGWQAVVSGLSLDAAQRFDIAGALAVAPASPLALEGAAEQHLAAGDTITAQALASQALAGMPIMASAIRVMAQAALARGDAPLAAALMNQGATLGWRDGPTQIWLALAAHQAGDAVSSALHLDAALRAGGVNHAMYALADSLIGDPTLRAELARRVALNPPWRQTYLGFPLQLPAERLAARASLLDDMAVQRLPVDHDEVSSVVNRLTMQGEFMTALHTWGMHQVSIGQPTGVPFDGDFANLRTDPITTAPLEWLSETPAGIASGTVAQNGGTALRVTSDGTASGRIVRQTLALSPGVHTLTYATAGDAGRNQLFYWALRCVGANADLDTVDSPLSDAPTAIERTQWIVPEQGCDLQFLSLRARPRDGMGSASATYTHAALY